MFILILATFALTPSLAAGNIVITRQPQNGTFRKTVWHLGA